MRELPRGSYRWLLLPCLNKVREFDGKLLLAATAAERGWGAIVGHKGFIEHDVFDVGGVVIERSFKARDLGRHLSAHRRVCSFDEEGLVFTNADDYCRRRLRVSTLQQLDAAFLWGQNQKAVILSCMPTMESKLRVTGSPRFDMLRPDLVDYYREDVVRLIERYGKFILINTNFGFVNHYFGIEYSLRDLRSQGLMTTSGEEEDQLARQAHEDRIMKAFAEMLPLLRTHLPDNTVIIRPHPSENFESWRDLAKDIPGVLVIHEGDVTPWLLAAAATIHNSCTTGIQSYLIDKPAIAYMPARSVKYEKSLPNQLSSVAETPDELLEALKEALGHPQPLDRGQALEWSRVAKANIESTSGRWAADRILDDLDQLDVEPQVLAYPAVPRGHQVAETGQRIFAQARALSIALRAALWPRRMPPEIANEGQYVDQTFPRLDIAEVRADLQRLRQLSGRFGGVEVQQTGDKHVCLHPVEH